MANWFQQPIQKAANWLVSRAAPPNQAWSTDASLWMQSGMDVAGPGRKATSAPVEAAISLVSNDIGTLALRYMQENSDGTVTEVLNSPISRVLKKPNEYQSKTDFIVQVLRSVFLYGNAYIFIDRDSRGQPRALYPLRDGKVTPSILPDGSVFYGVQLTELERGERALTEPMLVPASDIIHHRVLTTAHPLLGVSPLYSLGATATLNSAIAENMSRFHANSSRPGGILSIPGGLKQEARERLRQEFSKAFNGDQAGKTMVLDFDTKFEQMAYTAQESSVKELLQYTVEEVCRALRIPRHLMMLEGGAQVSVESGMRTYHSSCLRPLIEALENRFDDAFELHGTGRYIEFKIDDLFRAETDRRVESLTKGVQGGLFTVNEARRMEHLPPVDGGDAAFLQRQMTPVNLLSEIAALEAKPPEPAPVAPPVVNEPTEDEVKSLIMSYQTRSVLSDPKDIARKINEVLHG